MPASIAEKVRSELRVLEDLPSPAERRALRIRGGLSQQTVADIVGVSRHAISQWETGARVTPRNPQARRKYVEVLRTLREAA